MAEKAKATCQSVRPRSLSRTPYINARDSRISWVKSRRVKSQVESRKSREVHAGRQDQEVEGRLSTAVIDSCRCIMNVGEWKFL